MLALAMRQACRNGATIAVIDPRPVGLPFEFFHFPVALPEMERLLSTLIKRSVSRSAVEKLGPSALQFYDSIPGDFPRDSSFKKHPDAITEKLQQSRYPVIVCGTDIVRETTPGLAADHGRLLRAGKGRAGLFYLMPGANAFGAALLCSEKGSFMETIESVEKGTVKALVLVESDPFWSFPDQDRLRQAVERLDFLLVLDYLSTEAARHSDIFIPTRTLFEMESAYVNNEGRVQFSPATHRGGIPIEQIGDGNHPPRVFRSDIPGDERGPRS